MGVVGAQNVHSHGDIAPAGAHLIGKAVDVVDGQIAAGQAAQHAHDELAQEAVLADGDAHGPGGQRLFAHNPQPQSPGARNMKAQPRMPMTTARGKMKDTLPRMGRVM